MVNDVEQVLAELSANAGLPPIALDDAGRATLSFDEVDVTLSLDQERGALWLHADIGEILPGDPEALSFLLQLALGTWASNHMTLGLDEQGTGVVGLSAAPLATLDADTLETVLAAMLEMATAVRARLVARDYRTCAEAAGPAPPAQDTDQFVAP